MGLQGGRKGLSLAHALHQRLQHVASACAAFLALGQGFQGLDQGQAGTQQRDQLVREQGQVEGQPGRCQGRQRWQTQPFAAHVQHVQAALARELRRLAAAGGLNLSQLELALGGDAADLELGHVGSRTGREAVQRPMSALSPEPPGALSAPKEYSSKSSVDLAPGYLYW